MKTTVTILCIAVFGLMATTLAKHTLAGPRHGGKRLWSHEFHHPMDKQRWQHPYRRALVRHERLMSRLVQLDLTPAQCEKLHELFKSHASEFVDIAWPMTQAKHQLAKSIHSHSGDEQEIRTAADKLGDAIANAAVLRSKFRRAIDKVLTPEQSKRLQKQRETQHPRRGRRHTNPAQDQTPTD